MTDPDASASTAGLSRWDRAERRLGAINGVVRVQLDTDLAECEKVNALALRAARHPTDARIHLERINTLGERGDAEGVYGAVVDFLIGLGPKAPELRAGVLAGVAEVIGPERRAALAAYLDPGLRARDAIPPALHSLLTEGVTGTAVITDPLAEADTP